MKLRVATREEFDAVFALIDEAKEYLRLSGSTQWQDGYPNRQTIESDIQRSESYIITDNSEAIIGTAAISFESEPTYSVIEDGQWLTTSENYAVAHRIAVSRAEKGKGVTKWLLEELEIMCKKRGVASIRVDTHDKNLPMQRILSKLGYTHCGIIYVRDGSRRAYEKII